MPEKLKQKIYASPSDLLIGSIKQTPVSSYPSSQQDYQTHHFLSSPALVKKYGLWRDSDKDGYINMFDSYPFDKRRHGIISTITNKAKETYTKIDTKLGGFLPGGAPTSQPKPAAQSPAPNMTSATTGQPVYAPPPTPSLPSTPAKSTPSSTGGSYTPAYYTPVSNPYPSQPSTPGKLTNEQAAQVGAATSELTRGATESAASYQSRLASYGRAVAASDPKKANIISNAITSSSAQYSNTRPTLNQQIEQMSREKYLMGYLGEDSRGKVVSYEGAAKLPGTKITYQKTAQVSKEEAQYFRDMTAKGEMSREPNPVFAGYGGAMPITAGDVSGIVGGGIGVAKGFGFKAAGAGIQYAFSEPITKTASKVVDFFLPPADSGFRPSGAPKQVARGTIYAALMPVTGVAFGKEIAKSAVKEPVGTVREIGLYAVKSPYEAVTMLVAPRVPKAIKSAKSPYEIKIEGDTRPTFVAEGTKQGDLISGKTTRVSVTPVYEATIPRYKTYIPRLTTGKLNVPKSEFTPKPKIEITVQPFEIGPTVSTSSSLTRKATPTATLTKIEQAVEKKAPIPVESRGRLTPEQRYIESKLSKVVPEGVQTYEGVAAVFKGVGSDIAPTVVKTPTLTQINIPKRIERFSSKQTQVFYPTKPVTPEYVKSISRVKQVGGAGSTTIFFVEQASKRTTKMQGMARGNVRAEQGLVFLKEIQEPPKIEMLTGGKNKAKPKTVQTQSQIAAQVATLTPPPKTRPSTPSSSAPSTTLAQTGFPTSVSSLSTVTAQSSYYGTGQYERTEGGLLPGSLTGERSTSKQLDKTLQPNLYAQRPNEVTREKEELAQPTMFGFYPGLDTMTKSDNRQKDMTRLGESQSQRQPEPSPQKQEMQKPVLGPPTPPQRQPKKPKIPMPEPTKIKFPMESAQRKRYEAPYEVFVFTPGVGKRKVAYNVDRLTALSIGAKVTDETEADRFFIRRTTGPVNQSLKSSTWYSLSNKFRDFAQKSGVRATLASGYIEKEKYRKDSPVEKRGMKLFSKKR